jgi:hypothetical protein
MVIGELGEVAQADRCELVAHKVFDRFDVVSSYGFAACKIVNVVVVEFGDDCPQLPNLVSGEAPRPKQLVFGEVNEPFNFDLHTGTVQARLTEVLTEGCHLGLVSPVEGTEGLDAKRAHETTPCRILGGAVP